MISSAHIIEIALLILAAYLFGCIVGYGAHRIVRARRAPSSGHVSNDSSASSPPPQRSAARRLAGAVEREPSVPLSEAAHLRPPGLPAPRLGKPDDLKKIKGIGPKTESSLNDLGIYHHDQIAAWSTAHVTWLEGRIALKGRIVREQWIEQATLLVTETAQR